ncbi:hypothetical protein BDV96DRAFT_633309 [Lophiotrema nucula]|uniref:Uncharacterized protein n=1 Tax=Lophiotrema nucula TaxID=690887 RepID=A0A6A5Z363_9PLEO|nr:hypothetical protein BDV96DRAFT_633309 [Lophiotrema nucula]
MRLPASTHGSVRQLRASSVQTTHEGTQSAFRGWYLPGSSAPAPAAISFDASPAATKSHLRFLVSAVMVYAEVHTAKVTPDPSVAIILPTMEGVFKSAPNRFTENFPSTRASATIKGESQVGSILCLLATAIHFSSSTNDFPESIRKTAKYELARLQWYFEKYSKAGKVPVDYFYADVLNPLRKSSVFRDPNPKAVGKEQTYDYQEGIRQGLVLIPNAASTDINSRD